MAPSPSESMTPRYPEIAALWRAGRSPTEIAKALGLDERWVRGIVGSPMFQVIAQAAQPRRRSSPQP